MRDAAAADGDDAWLELMIRMMILDVAESGQASGRTVAEGKMTAGKVDRQIN
jgi:hypothetical protein